MKKNGLFKILFILIIAIVLLSWFVPGGYYSGEFVSAGYARLGFFDFCQYLVLPFFQSMFLEVLIFLLSVGAFYAVLGNTGTYRNMLEKIAKKIGKKGNWFLIITAFVFAALSSFGGYGLIMFMFIPAIISLVLLLGYDKLTALLVTFGSMLVGAIGATYASYIGYSTALLSLEFSSQIFFKLSLFVFSFIILILFTLKHAKKAKKANEKKSADTPDLFLGEKAQNKKKSIGIYIVFGILFILMILGATAWGDVFGIEAFTTLHENIMNLAIKDFTILYYILGNSTLALGTWSYFQFSIMLLLASFLIGKIYKLKLKEIIESIVDGVKKIIKPALLVTFAYAVLILVVNSGVFTTLMSYVLEGAEKFNVFIASLITIVGSALHIEPIYMTNFFMPYLVGVYSSETAAAIMNVLTQAFNSLTMFVAPTSLFLILGLTYLDIPYKKWLKFSWKLVLELFIIIVVVIVTMMIVIK